MDTKLSSFGSAAIVTGLMLLSAIRAAGASDFWRSPRKPASPSGRRRESPCGRASLPEKRSLQDL